MHTEQMTWIRRQRVWQIVAMLAIGCTCSVAYGQFGNGGFGRSRLPAMRSQKQDRPTYQPPVYEHTGQGEPVVAVKIIGNDALPEDQIRTHLQTRVGRELNPETIQADVRRLSATGMFRNVKTYRKAVKGGVEVTFQVFELPIIQHIRFEGNKKIKDKTLLKRSELAKGESLHRYRLEEATRKLKELYIERGFSDAEVQIREGNQPGDKGVVFSIHEGKQQRIFRTRFEGNTIVTDGRLKTQIESKPGLLWVWKGKVDRDKIESDRERIVSYYRSLGYFTARVGRYLEFDNSGKWLTLTFVIDEGPRYKIRNVSLVGNKTFTTESLQSRLQLTSGDYFDARKMNSDLNALRETYGGEGYIHSDINADPRFLEEPAMIDLVYDIDEGEQYRVGRIIVNIEGENPHTRRNVVINRLSLAPNDIININEVRASERRLRSSQLFKTDPASGVTPTIAIRAPELSEGPAVANQPDRSGGSPY